MDVPKEIVNLVVVSCEGSLFAAASQIQDNVEVGDIVQIDIGSRGPGWCQGAVLNVITVEDGGSCYKFVAQLQMIYRVTKVWKLLKTSK